MLNIPRVFHLSSIKGFQIVRSLPFEVDDPRRSFLTRPQLSMSWVSGCQGDPFKDEVSNVEVPGLHHCIILPSHEVFVSCCSLFCVHSYLINKIKVEAELFFILLVLILHHPVVSHEHFRRYDRFASIGQFEGSFPCGVLHNRPVSP